MTRTSASRVIRPLFVLIVALFAGAGLVGCVHHSDRDIDDDPEVHVTVLNLYSEDVYVEAVDPWGYVMDLGIIRENHEVTFGIDDDFEGGDLYARCACDGHIVEITGIWDGKFWTVD